MSICITVVNALKNTRKNLSEVFTKKVTADKADNFKVFVEGIIKVSESVNWDNYGPMSLSRDMFDDADVLVKNLTGANSVKDFVDNASENQLKLAYDKLKGYVQTFSSMIEDPKKVINSQEAGRVATNILKYYTSYNKKATASKFSSLKHPMDALYNFFFAPNVFFKNKEGDIQLEYMVNRDAAFRMHRPINELKINAEQIQNSTSKLADMSIVHNERIITESVSKDVTAMMINKLIKFMDPSQSAPELLIEGANKADIDTKVKSRLKEALENQFSEVMELKENKEAYVDIVYDKMLSVQAKFNKWNYGVENPLYYDSKNPNAYHPITKQNLLTDAKLKDSVDYGDGKFGDPFLVAMFTNGIKLNEMIKGIKNTPRVLKEAAALWDPDNPEGFKIRLNYFPTAKTNDMFSDKMFEYLATASGNFNMKYDNAEERTKLYDATDDNPATMSDLVNNNMKAFRFYFDMVPEYASNLKAKQMLNDDNTLIVNNKNAYDILRYYTESRIEAFENPKFHNPLSNAKQSYKHLLLSLAGLAVGARLTASAVTNLVAGKFNSAIKQSWKDQRTKRGEFKVAKEGKDVFSDFANTIDHDVEYYSVMDKISSVITKEAESNQQIARTKLLEFLPKVMDNVAKKLDTTSDRLINQMYGILPKAWELTSMGGTENYLMRYAAAEAYFDCSTHGEMFARSNGWDPDNLSSEQKTKVTEAMRTNYDGNKEFYYNTIKQMFGSYSKSAKAMYAHDFMKSAEGIGTITAGAALILHSTFKQINVNNADMIARVTSTDYAKALTMNKNERPVNLQGAGGVILLGLYNFIRENVLKDLGDKYTPDINMLANVDIFQDADMKYKAINYAIKEALNLPTDQREMMEASMYYKFLLGIGFGGSQPKFSAEIRNGKYESGEKLYDSIFEVIGDYVKPRMDFGVQQTIGIFKGLSADDKTPAQRKAIINSGYAKGAFYMDGGSKILRLVRDLGVILREVPETYFGDSNQKDEDKLRTYIGDAVLNLANTNFYMPDVPYANDYSGSIYNQLSKYTHLSVMSKDWDNRDYARAKYYRNQQYQLDKALRGAMYDLKAPSYELKRIKNDLLRSK